MKVASNMGEELLVKVIEEEVAKRGVHTRLCPPDLHTMFTACINKASLEEGAQQEAKTRETKEDFLRLGLVGGARIIRLLLEEAAKHKGQAASVAGILSLFSIPSVHTRLVEEIIPYYLSLLGGCCLKRRR